MNNYRWFRGFNDYDNWQASGVSGQGARSFYYPPKPTTCADCHMPLVASQRSRQPRRQGPLAPLPGRQHGRGLRESRRGAAEGRAKKFLQSGFITVDIFAARRWTRPRRQRSDAAARRRAGPQLSSTFAVGEEAEQTGPVILREVGKVAAPHRCSPAATFQPGIHRARGCGGAHAQDRPFLPGRHGRCLRRVAGIQAQGCDGPAIFWSGQVEDDGRGPVEPGAHFYRSFQLDGEGNPINKRNAWQARSALVRAADSARRGRRGALPRAHSARTRKGRSRSRRG